MINSRQNVLTIDFDLGNIRSKSQFFKEIKSTFYLPNNFYGDYDSLNDWMRDLSWFEENYLLLNFLQSERLKRFPTLYENIMESIEDWQEFWHNIEKYSVDENYYNKTVVISIT